MRPAIPRLALLCLALSFAARAQQPPAEESVLEAAAARAGAGKYAEAASLLETHLAARPRSTDRVYLMLAECRLAARDPDRAFDSASAGLKVHPRSGPLAKFAGILLFRYKPETPQPGELLAKAVAALPKDPEARHFYAQWALVNRQEEVAIAQAKQVLALSPGNALARQQAYTLIGMAHVKLNRDEQAEESFRKALDLNRKLPRFDSRSALEHVRLLIRNGRGDEAMQLAQEILKHSPSFAPAHLEIAKHHDAQERPEQAVAEAELALKLEGSLPDEVRGAHALLARLYFRLGKPDKAEPHQKWVQQNR